jgi:hypothetical protein
MNPLNAELVQQIDSYVSPKYQKLLDEEGSQVGENMNPAGGENSESSPGSGSSSSSSGGGSSFSKGSGSFSGGDIPGMITDEPDESSDSDIDDTSSEVSVPESAPASDSEPDDDSVEQSTVIASSCTEKDASLETETMKGSLNAVEDTAGVTRIRVKDKELWIYYQDSVNLNSVMGPVIDSMNALGYTYLEFSRLARSDNAIVFDIYDSTQPIQPLERDEDGKKEEA